MSNPKPPKDEAPIKDEKSDLVYEERHVDRGPGSGDPRGQWLPLPFEYQGKAVLNPQQAHKLVMFRMFVKRNERHLLNSEILLDAIDEYLATTPSINGRGRAEHVQVLTNGLVDKDGDGGLMNYLATLNPMGDDDD